jgi:hypothetical protein
MLQENISGNGILTEWRSPAEGFLERHNTCRARKMEASKSSAALNRACAHKLKRRREETSSTEAEAETY